MTSLEKLTIAGVPLLLRSPDDRDRHAPLILFWHGFGSPNGEVDIAEAFPLEPVEAWKAYLGLPLFGQRSVGDEDLMRRQMEDYVLNLLLPVVEQAVQELPQVVAGLRSHCELDSHSTLGLFGFSAGGIAALLALAESDLPLQAVVLVGVTKDLSAAVRTYEKFTQSSYEMLKEQYPKLKSNYQWSESSRAAEVRLDFIAHSKRIVRREPLPAILFAHGVQDEAFDLEDAKTLHDAVRTQYQRVDHAEKVSFRTFQHLKHAIDLASNSSPEQQADLAEMETVVTDWFKQYL
ncbi:MAG: prolyl oligopeptidase family serine peptidase [Phormidesmis sp.]